MVAQDERHSDEITDLARATKQALDEHARSKLLDVDKQAKLHSRVEELESERAQLIATLVMNDDTIREEKEFSAAVQEDLELTRTRVTITQRDVDAQRAETGTLSEQLADATRERDDAVASVELLESADGRARDLETQMVSALLTYQAPACFTDLLTILTAVPRW